MKRPLHRNVTIQDTAQFKGEWIVIPREDFDWAQSELSKSWTRFIPWSIVLFALWYIGTHLIVEAVCR
jgi:hypothetical protein